MDITVYFDYADNLVFDYFWQAGDTVKDCLLSQYCKEPMIVASIDSVLISDRYHLRYNFDSNYGGTISWFVEGIGHDFGIWHLACMVPDQGSYFKCYAENGEPIFPEDANCILTVDVDDFPNNDNNFEIYPNPASTQISIRANSITETDITINIVDLTGRVLLNKLWKQARVNHLITLNLCGLKPGIYFVTLTNENGESMARKKILVE